MSLSKEAIEEFKKIFYREFGRKLSDEEAHEKAQNLLSLFRIIYRTIPEDEDLTKNSGSES
jgi:hypothetical protein